MYNPEKLATRRRITKQKQNTIFVGHHYTQTNTNNVIRHEAFYKQQEVKTNRTSFLCRNHNGHHNRELRT